MNPFFLNAANKPGRAPCSLSFLNPAKTCVFTEKSLFKSYGLIQIEGLGTIDPKTLLFSELAYWAYLGFFLRTGAC